MAGWRRRLGARRTAPDPTTVALPVVCTPTEPAVIAEPAGEAVWGQFAQGFDDVDHPSRSHGLRPASVVIRAPRADALNGLSGAPITAEP